MHNSVMQDGPEFRCWAHRQALLQDRERSLPVPGRHILRNYVRCRNHGWASKLADRADHEPQHDGGPDGGTVQHVAAVLQGRPERGSIARVPAPEIEAFVISAMRSARPTNEP